MDDDYYYDDYGSTNDSVQDFSGTGEEYSIQGHEIAWVTILCVITVLGLLFNGIAILINCVLKDYKKTSQWYVLNLAIADTAFLLMLPIYAVERSLGGWKLGSPLCVLSNTLFTLNYNAGIFFLTAMSFDRYVAIIHPMSVAWRKLRSRNGCWAITLLVWILAFAASVHAIVHTQVVNGHCGMQLQPNGPEETCYRQGIPEEHCDTYLTLLQRIEDGVMSSEGVTYSEYGDKRHRKVNHPEKYEYTANDVPRTMTRIQEANETDYAVFDEVTKQERHIAPHCEHYPYPGLAVWIYTRFVLTFLLPLFVMMFCYGCILWRILHPRYRSRRSSNGSASANACLKKDNVSSNRTDANRRATLLVISLVVAFIVCWTPHYAHHLTKIKGMKNLSEQQCINVIMAAHLMTYCINVLNPLLYTFLGVNFRKRARRVLDRIKGRRSSAASGLPRSSRSSYKNGGSATKISKMDGSSGSGGQSNISMHSLVHRDEKQEQQNGCTNHEA